MVVPSTLLTWSDLFLLHSSQDHLKVLIVAWSASAFGSFEHVLWQYLPQRTQRTYYMKCSEDISFHFIQGCNTKDSLKKYPASLYIF